MEPFPTEVAPRTVCARCGTALARPNGSATYVYGVGPVGYQHCSACGANWRYLWHDQPAPRIKPRGGRGRLFAALGGLVLATVVAVGVVALARSQHWNSGSPSTTSASKTPKSTTPQTVSQAAADEYATVADSMYSGRKDFMDWVQTTAASTPEYLVDDRVKSYVGDARADLAEVAGLDRRSWPPAVSSDVDQLITADRTFLGDVDLLQNAPFLNSPSFLDRLNHEALAVRAADNQVRQALGLAQVA